MNTKAILSKRLHELKEIKLDEDYQNTIPLQAKGMKISYPTLIKYINGNTECPAKNIVKIASYYGISTDYLLGLSNVKSTDTDLKGVCEYTGLSEKAVAVLKNLNSAAVGSGIDSDVYNNGRQAKGLIISSIDLPINILNMLLENVHLLSMVYSYLVLTSDIGENNNVYIGDRANSVLFEIALEMRKIRDSFQLEYTKIFKTLKEKDSANNGEHTGKTE